MVVNMNDINQRWYDYITDIVVPKIHKKEEHSIKLQNF